MTTYVLGAGASFHAGYPFCSELWSRMAAWTLENESPESEHVEAVSVITALCGPVVDVEQLFTDLAAGHGAFRSLAIAERQSLQGKMRRALRAFFLNIRARNLPACLYSDLASRIEAGDTLITFNYDVALENELIRAQRFRIRNGYGRSFPADWDEQNSDATVLKLHGSINWIGVLFGGARGGHVGTFSSSLGPRPFVDNVDSVLFGYPARILDKSFPGGGVVDGATTLVLPAYEKQFYIQTSVGDEWGSFYDSVWSEAAESLAAAKRIVIIGYSMPDADQRSRVLLLRNASTEADIFFCCASSNQVLIARFRQCGFSRLYDMSDFEHWLAREEMARQRIPVQS